MSEVEIGGEHGAEPRLTAAEALFLEFLSQQEAEAPVDFDEFLRRHAALADELRRLHDDWLGVARVAARLREDEDGRAATTAKRGDSELHLASDGEGPGSEVAGELLRRLVRERTSAARYERREEIGRGGMGIVHRVFDPVLRRQLAMKVILARKSDESPQERERTMQRALARFLEEAQVTSQLDHPGIVPVHELGIDATGRVYFTMRLVRGRELRKILDLVKRGEEGWTRTRALHVLLKACEAIAYAHDKRVIHRDLKPANVMVGRFGEVYVMDWGLARVLGRRDAHQLELRHSSDVSAVETDRRRFGDATPGSPLMTLDGNVLGTPQYMSPEQAANRIDAMGPRSDVYSLGAILYELLAGHAPFTPPGAPHTPRSVWQALMAGPPPPLEQAAPDAPEELVEICRKAMARKADARYASALELAAEIEAFLHRRPVAAHAPTLPYLARLWYERNRTLARVAGAALLLVAALSALFSWWHHVEQQEVERLGRLRLAEALATEAERQFLPDPELVPEIERWLREVDALLPTEAATRERLARAKERSDLRETQQLEAPAVALERLRETLRPAVAAWLAPLRSLRATTLEAPAAAEAWRAALADLAGDPRFAGFALQPRLGLVPLRKDRDSGLWEFWVALSGAAPRVDESAPRGYALEEGSGIVLVLVPPGEVDVGFPSRVEVELTQVAAPGRHAVEAPLLVSKFEVTQAQFTRVMGFNPSQFIAGYSKSGKGGGEHAITGLHPVESVVWADADAFCGRLGLELPAEKDWEYFARAGARGAVWWHAEPELAAGVKVDGKLHPSLRAIVAELAAHENYYDASCADVQPSLAALDGDDGFAYHAPVGSKAKNGFGLFDVLGNVAEWCRDRYEQPGMKLVKRDFRGGHWLAADPPLLFLSRVQTDNPSVPQSYRGFRPVAPFAPAPRR